MSISDRVRVKNVRLLSDDYGTLKNTTFEWRRANGAWQTQQRETYDGGNSASVLPYNLSSVAWCWCGNFAIRPTSMDTTIS